MRQLVWNHIIIFVTSNARRIIIELMQIRVVVND